MKLKDILNFIFSFKQALRQGSTKHAFFIIQFDKENKIAITLNLSEEDLQKKYSEPLQAEYDELTYEIFTKMFKVITNINIVIPGSFKKYCFFLF
jgi:hypothetical protein